MYMKIKLDSLKTFVVVVSIIIVLNACATGGAAPDETDPPVDRTAQYEQAIRDEQNSKYNILRGILKMHSTFRGTTENADIQLQFDFTDENFSVLRTKYGLEAIAGTGDDLSKSLNILFWLCEHTYHKGMYDNHVPMNTLDLLEYAYDTDAERGINCLNLAYILTECLLSIGVPARTVLIMPFSPYDADNHVVTHAYIADLDKWIMLDPTWCSYFKDEAGNILDVVELRSFLADGKDVFLNNEFSYNGDNLIANDEQVQYYKRYLAKDLFYFTTYETSGFGRENYGRSLAVCPADYNLFEAGMYSLEYRIEVIRTDKSLSEGFSEEFLESYIESSTKRLEDMRNLAKEHEGAAEEAAGYVFLSLEDFLAKPELENK
jgi:hypothetical protein